MDVDLIDIIEVQKNSFGCCISDFMVIEGEEEKLKIGIMIVPKEANEVQGR